MRINWRGDMISRHFDWCCNYMRIEHNGQACPYVVLPKLVRPERTQNCLWQGSERRRFTLLRLELKDSKKSTLESGFKNADFVWINRRFIRIKKIWGFKSIRIRVCAITYNKNFLKFTLLYLSQFVLHSRVSARTRVDWYPFTVVHGSFCNTPYLFPHPCAGEEEQTLRFSTQLLIVMSVPGVHVSELLRFDAFMNRNASLFSDRYIVTIYKTEATYVLWSYEMWSQREQKRI